MSILAAIGIWHNSGWAIQNLWNLLGLVSREIDLMRPVMSGQAVF
jgi:hypothetical protein